MVSRPHQITSKREPPRRLLRTSSSAFFSFSPVAFFFTDHSRENRHYISSLLIQRPLLTSITEFDKLSSQRSTRKHCKLYWSNWWLGTTRVKDRGLSMGGGEEWSRSYWEAFRLNSMVGDRSRKLGLIHSIGIVLWRRKTLCVSSALLYLYVLNLFLSQSLRREEKKIKWEFAIKHCFFVRISSYPIHKPSNPLFLTHSASSFLLHSISFLTLTLPAPPTTRVLLLTPAPLPPKPTNSSPPFSWASRSRSSSW